MIKDEKLRCEYGRRRGAYGQSELLLEKILSTTQAAIFWKDGERRFLGANQACLNYYGFSSEEEIIGRTDADMGWHLFDEPFRSDEEKVLTEGISTYRVHGKCMCRGEMRDILASKSPVVENGKIVGLVGSFIDVTDEYRKNEEILALNERMRKSCEQAEQANEAKTAFLANVSHDMRTPLNGILGFVELASRSEDIGQIKYYLEKIQASGELLKDLINDTLELSRIANGRQALNLESIEASTMLDTLLLTIQAKAERCGVRFCPDIHWGEVGRVRVDQLKLSKVLLNLLSNAVRFTPRGGTVWFEGTATVQREIGCVHCRFVVRDNGIGMEASFLDRLFEPFEQEDPGAKSGTGLGLAIVDQLLVLMNGTIEVKSEKGKGSEFVVQVSLRLDEKEESLCDAEAYNSQMLVDRKILLCEDNPLNQEIIVSMLELNGMTVIKAENGQQGVDIFEKSDMGAIDAILMDIRMPVMDGLQAAKAIRSLLRRDAGRVPILAISANAFQEDKKKSRAAGMNGHLTKPLELPELLKNLMRCIADYDKWRSCF